MGRSLSMAAYRALSRRQATRSFIPGGPRPRGELVWLHAAEPDSLPAVEDLALRLSSTRDGLHVLITLPDRDGLDAARSHSHGHESLHLDEVPSEHPTAVRSFLSHWAPDMCLWCWGGLRPTLVHEAHEAGCPIALIDADTRGFDGRRDRWLPDLSRDLLTEFVALMARSPAAAGRLEVLGLSMSDVQVTPPLQAGGQALACDDADLADTTAVLAGRPVWLATGVQQEELATILAAHRHALRYSHRLLLILHPAERAQAGKMARDATAEGLRVCEWAGPGEPGETAQIMIAHDRTDLGLFYRLAPVSFLGSSLSPERGGCNPFEAAALGSAVLYGPNVRRYLPFYSRLANAGAARMVGDAQSLGAAVTTLIAPDRAAEMAHAGWDVISHGAELTDRVTDLVESTLDARLEQKNATA